MAETDIASGVPVPEKALRDLAKNVSRNLPNFSEQEPAVGVKGLRDIITPVLETADLPDLGPGHRAAASNALCAIIEFCQVSNTEYARSALLEDFIWLRLFEIYLQRSDDAKGKSMRQMLLVLTSVITKDQSQRALELRNQATTTFLDIICQRQDRVKVKPALQGLAHFLLRDVASISQLIEIYEQLLEQSSSGLGKTASSSTLFEAFLAWIVHHDTSLSAGNLVKNFLIQARRLPDDSTLTDDDNISPFWIEPVVRTLHYWPDRVQEFKTHVFPHCFLPNIDEYMRFLSYLHFGLHVQPKGALCDQLRVYESHENGLDESEEFRILLAAIQAGKELTIIRDSDHRICDTIDVRDGAIYLPNEIFGGWMSHHKPEVRLAGMFLSVYSTATTKPVPRGVFKSLKRNLIHLHTETDANFRREVHGYTQKLFDRLRASTAMLSKGKSKSGATMNNRLPLPRECFRQNTSLSKYSSQDPLIESLTFVVWYIRFLEWELRPTASYQRRITALRSLTIVLRSGIDPGVPHSHLSKSAQGQLTWAHGLQTSNDRLVRVLLDLILDPFDDVRDAAVSILQMCLEALPDTQKNAVMATLPRFLSRAETVMLRTGRADQADGVARAYSLIFSLATDSSADSSDSPFSSKLGVFKYLKTQLDQTLDIAHKNLSEAVDGRPVHGTFAALRYIVDQDQFYSALSGMPIETFGKWKQFHDDIVGSFESLWLCIHHVLCADAPEGHVPEEMEEEASLDTKEILSYSWRGLKEASVLLRTVISKAPIGNDDRALITPEYFDKLGRLCFTQLLELRHRGAFSTVAQTFAVFCRRCATSNIASLRALPDTWYRETLRSMHDKAGAITRRSAGIPALMSGIIAAEPPSGGKFLQRAMKDLIAEASAEAQNENIEESRLPQVHALNCIKEIFTTSRLSVASEAYIGQGLELASKTLNSNIWPIRNCSLMLFKALIERLLGSDEAQDWKERDRAKTSRFSYDNYPSLVGILTDLLDPNGPLKKSIEGTSESSSPFDLHGAEGVFPALQILRQARPPDADLGPILKSVEKLLASPHWHLRDMAARTVVSLRSSHQLRDAAFSMLDTVPSSTNTQHGVLLAVKYMLRKLMHSLANLDVQTIEDLMADLTVAAGRWYVASNCPFIRSAFLDIVSLCGMSVLQRQEHDSTLNAWSTLTAAVSIGPEYALGVSKGEDGALLRGSLAQLFFIDRTILRNDTLSLMVSDEYQSIGDALALLAAEDPDTCCTALDTLATIIQLKASNSPVLPISLILSHIHHLVLSATDAEVLSAAQAVLADALTNPYLQPAFFSLTTQSQILSTLTTLETQYLAAPPSNTQSALHLQAFFLDRAFSTHPTSRRPILGIIARYIRILRTTITDTTPFPTRFAAAQSLAALTHTWTLSPTSKATSPLLLALSLLLLDLLHDDDDEIRDVAALAAGTLLRAHVNVDVENAPPLLTAHRLASFLTTAFPASKDLQKEALRRLTATNPLFTPRFAEVLARERKTDTALFATEKQNLFTDDALIASLWGRVASCMPACATQELRAWTLDALAVLQRTARTEEDGALGWCGKSEVFALVLRVLGAGGVLLRSGEKEREGVMRGLGVFADVGERGGVHGLVLERVGGMVEGEVVRGLRGVYGGMRGSGLL
ncbi:hypothetical protein P153DRAFT_425326 [Dothidotthia symphoricarpi CBS 119687]|uniref:Uncharacterized protein n=1 Tax=Dothidotthia symphoricarpi CBS 119687 TaxID=1392245 RepID=A0A6A6A2B3_9PLEO|nr:uncharacterized protein P153DRAFT_425326 [Dothidotthia symphoricarpi CBS 119687]KAF2126132.1 hypothetical protein P153DRAFT_425326 [Dothidotthia symphoricarpi CBS 119687]